MSAAEVLTDSERQHWIDVIEQQVNDANYSLSPVANDCEPMRQRVDQYLKKSTDEDNNFLQNTEILLQLWGAWSRYYGRGGYLAPMSHGSVSTPIMSDRDAGEMDSIVGTLKHVSFVTYDVVKQFYIHSGAVSRVQERLNMSRERVNTLLGSGRCYVCAAIYYSDLQKDLRKGLQFAR